MTRNFNKPYEAHILSKNLIYNLVLCFFGSIFLLTPKVFADDVPDSLNKVMQVMSGKHWNDVVTEAKNQINNGTVVYRNIPPLTADGKSYQIPYYHSFEGDFTPDVTTTKLAIFSDDGCDVTVDGNKVWSGKGQGQGLPYLDQSLHKIPITLIAGQTYHIRVDYSNTNYTGDLDIDGATLFAYGVSKWDWTVDGWNLVIDSSPSSNAAAMSHVQTNSMDPASTSSDDGGTYLVAVRVEMQFSYDPKTGSVTPASEPHIEAIPVDPVTGDQLRVLASPHQSQADGVNPTEYEQHYYLAFTKDFLRELGKDYESGAARDRIGYTFKGMGFAIVDTAKGTIHIIIHPGETVSGISTAIKNPKRVIAAINKAGQEYIDSSSTDPNAFAENTGKIAGEISLSVLGTKGVGKIGELGKVARVTLITKAVRTGTFWKLFNPASELRAGTLLPKYFSLKVAGRKLYVSPGGGVKHLVEKIITRAPAGSSNLKIAIATRKTLNEFASALASGIKGGYTYGVAFYDSSRHWQFVILKGTNLTVPEPLDAVTHALYISEGF